MHHLTAVIVAAGQGTRMGPGEKKQYRLLGKRPVLAFTLAAFQTCAGIDEIILVTQLQDQAYCREKIVRPYGFDKVVHLVPGGSTRQESVRQGLKFVSPQCNSVVVHDGARPLLSPDLLERVIEAGDRWGAATAAVPAKDTVKLADEEGFVVQTLPRARLWLVQTPQIFRCRDLLTAHRRFATENDAPDDASLVERLGIKVKLVMGAYSNIKITTPEDLHLAAELIAAGEEDRDD